MTGIEAVMGAAVGLAEALDVSQDEEVAPRERAAARRETRDYIKKLSSTGLNVFFLDDGGVPVALRSGRLICWVMLTSKRKLGLRAVAKMVARGESLEGKLSPLRNAILVLPVQDRSLRAART